MADYFFTFEAFGEREDFIRRQGGAESVQAKEAVAAVDQHAKIIAGVMATQFITLEMYLQAESHWAHDQYEVLVAVIKAGVMPGMEVNEAGDIVISAAMLEALSQE